MITLYALFIVVLTPEVIS